jgi:CRISPR-associated protein Cas1
MMDKKDFIVTENYNLRIKPTGARKIVNEFSNMLNKKVNFQGKEKFLGYIVFLKDRFIEHKMYKKR